MMQTTDVQPTRPASKFTRALPGSAVPYVVRAGSGPVHLVAGQVIHTLAGAKETAGGFGVVTVTCPFDARPIPMHWHEREHDTWLVARGKVQVWCEDQSRVLHPGDFAYVRPGDRHSYRSVAPHSRFFGIIAPGGWEEFFVDAGEAWAFAACPAADRPFDFSRMGPAMGKHGVNRVDDAVYVEASPMGLRDRQSLAEPASFFLEAGHGTRAVAPGRLTTRLLGAPQTNGALTIDIVEVGRDGVINARTGSATFLYVLEGTVELELAGTLHMLSAGDGANIPADEQSSWRVVSGSAQVVRASNGEFPLEGETTEAHFFPIAG